MKGLCLSAVALVCYGLSVMLAAHVLRPKRHFMLFAVAIPIWAGIYVLLHQLTPRDLYFLPPTWQCSNQTLDLFYGLVLFLFNCHSFVCGVVVACSGFSVSLLVAIHEAGSRPLATEDLVAKFRVSGDTDRIYGWRIPHLEQRGYLRKDPATGNYILLPKGRVIARIAFCFKRLMNLGKGG